MSRDRSSVTEQTQQLLNGPLKHVRAAALAAALMPLASVAATPAVAQVNPSGGNPPTVSVPEPCDFVTSGGFVYTDNGTKANFGVHGGCKHEAFWGNVNFVDHATGYHLNSLDITGYLTPEQGSNVRDICGSATTNNPSDSQPVYFRIRLVDNGEPGTSDLFGIRLSNGYHIAPRPLGKVGPGGGNVQLHDPNPSTTAPLEWSDEFTMCMDVPEP